MLAASSVGVLLSANSGSSWTNVLPGEATDVVQHPTLPGVFYAALGDLNGAAENGVYRSTNGGFSWTRISGALGPPTSFGRTAIAVSPARPGSVWAIAANPTDRKFRSLSRFDDAASTWVNLPANGILFQSNFLDFGAQSEYNLVIGVDPDDENRVIIGGVRLFRSRDGGVNFQQIAANVHSDWHALSFDPQDPRRIVTGCDGGIFTSTNGGDSWRSLNSGITATQFYPGIAVHPSNPGIVIGGTQDNGSMMSNGALFWAGISYGDGGWAMIDYTNPNLVLTSSQFGNLQRHDLSTRSFQPLPRRYAFQPSFITPFIIDPLNPRTVYAGTRALERSIDFGSNWQPVSPQLQGAVSALAVNRGSPQTFLVGTQTGFVAVSQDGGGTWASGTIVPRAVSDIASDPIDPSRFAITWSGFNAPKVGLSVNGGLNYTNISGNLPDIPVNAVVFTPNRSRIFVGTDIGVFETTNGGASWVLTLGLPNVPVTDLVYHAASNRIIAGTYGRGIWSLALATQPPVLRGDVDRNGVVNAADALLIQQALAAVRLPSPLTGMPHGDANCNGALDAADALIVLRFAVGLGAGGTCVNTAQ
ncbi:MAG: dockerin type I domain-containing protein [Gemmatimonadaceae bacterium]